MEKRCPGQSLAFINPKNAVYYINCPSCDTEIEFWFDDKKRKCYSCKEIIQPPVDILMRHHSCSSHCASALDCLGEENYVQMVLSETRTKIDAKNELEKILSFIPDKQPEVKEFLKTTIGKNIEQGYLLEEDIDLDEIKQNNKNLYKEVKNILTEYVLKK